MAGFLIAIGQGEDGLNAIRKCINSGVYSTVVNVSCPVKNPFSATLGDYCSMKEGDKVFFFSKRKIYGIGKIVKIGPDCKLKNYPDSCKIVFRAPSYDSIKNLLLLDDGPQSVNEPWLFAFEPDPNFYCDGVDMDDVLEYKPQTFKAIRTFWKKSFTKMDDEETESLTEFILLRNLHKKTFDYSNSGFGRLLEKVDSRYMIDPEETAACQQGVEGAVSSEMTLEAFVVDSLMKGRVKDFGKWDYVTHQLCASPFKPIDYMDKIDVFAYKNIPNSKAISKFLVIELKKDQAPEGTVGQIAKYVDYICKNYAYGDYGRIEAMIIARSFDEKLVRSELPLIERNYFVGSHPAVGSSWNNLRFFTYSFYQHFEFKEIKFKL
jgi:hypothetical protein